MMINGRSGSIAIAASIADKPHKAGPSWCRPISRSYSDRSYSGPRNVRPISCTRWKFGSAWCLETFLPRKRVRIMKKQPVPERSLFLSLGRVSFTFAGANVLVELSAPSPASIVSSSCRTRHQKLLKVDQQMFQERQTPDNRIAAIFEVELEPLGLVDRRATCRPAMRSCE
jgi:hypothetical protein